jgi:hypothetical protein
MRIVAIICLKRFKKRRALGFSVGGRCPRRIVHSAPAFLRRWPTSSGNAFGLPLPGLFWLASSPPGLTWRHPRPHAPRCCSPSAPLRMVFKSTIVVSSSFLHSSARCGLFSAPFPLEIRLLGIGTPWFPLFTHLYLGGAPLYGAPLPHSNFVEPADSWASLSSICRNSHSPPMAG